MNALTNYVALHSPCALFKMRRYPKLTAPWGFQVSKQFYANPDYFGFEDIDNHDNNCAQLEHL